MSYVLIDAKGDARDFATNLGLQVLRNAAGPLVLAFLDAGVLLDTDDAQALAEEIEGNESWGYIAGIVRDMQAPIVLSNGVEEE